MTPGARVAAAIALLDAWRDGVPIEKALTNWARGARYAGARDRAAVRDHVYDVLRRLGSCRALGAGEDGRALMIGLLRLDGIDPADRFTGEGHAPSPLGAAEETTPAPWPEAWEDVPGWTRGLLSERAPDAAQELIEALRHRAPVWLRVNPRKASPETAVDRLAADGIETETDHRGARALRVASGARRVKTSGAYNDGLVEVQDLSAQRAVEAVDWPPGRILDLCAGGGGKTLAIAAITDATLFADDAAPARMRDLPRRAARAGVDITTCGADGPEGHAPFDAVLCDVPCSGSGVWRRDPEAKWRLTPARLAAFQMQQADILDRAARLVRPGGRLVFMTCSLFRCENEDQVAAFVERHPGWRCRRQHCDTPLTASDGFFHAVLDTT
jgi:16S rRNA (cytosine967-C5)-methyltransferase